MWPFSRDRRLKKARKELSRLVAGLKEGKVSGEQVVRKAVYIGALDKGYTPKEALEASSDPSLANSRVNFRFV